MSSPFSIFNLCALAYDLLTGQDLWREQIATLLQYVPDPKNLRVLDVGCGPGVSTFVLAEKLGMGSVVTGIDLAHKMIARALHHHKTRFSHLKNVQFLQADASHLPFENGSFDLITGHSFLYLVHDRRAVLADIRRVLAPKGRLVLMEPNAGTSLFSAGISALVHTKEFLRRPNATARFASCMVLWRCFSLVMGKMSPELVERLFSEAGFQEISCHPTLGGLGLHCVGCV
jgi:ubiquinone/menaquinone biosynthesis C-methylase UbiE